MAKFDEEVLSTDFDSQRTYISRTSRRVGGLSSLKKLPKFLEKMCEGLEDLEVYDVELSFTGLKTVDFSIEIQGSRPATTKELALLREEEEARKQEEEASSRRQAYEALLTYKKNFPDLFRDVANQPF